MAILFVGSEDISFQIDGSYGVSTSGTFPTGLRQSLTLSGATALTAALSAAAGSLWVSMSLYKHGAASGGSLVRFYADTTFLLGLGINASGQLELSSGSIIQTSTRTIDLDTLFRLDVQVDFSGGHVRVYRRSDLLLSYDGALGAEYKADHLVLTNPGPTDPANTLDVSGVLVQTVSTRRANLYALVPDALIERTDWTGTVADLSEAKRDDTFAVSTNTSNAVLTASLTSTINLNVPIRAIVESARVSGVDPVQIGLRNGTPTYSLNAPVKVSDSNIPQNYNYVVGSNPFTGNIWNSNDLNGLAFTIKMSDDGMTYLVDTDGNAISDEDGNPITP